MGHIHTKAAGLSLIRERKARADGLTYDEHRQRTYMALTNYEAQRVDHYPVGDGDLRETPAGLAAIDEARTPLGRPPLPPEQRKPPTPVCTLRLAEELHPVLRALHKSGRLETYLRRAAKGL